MKHTNPTLITLWTAAILTIGIGLISAIHSVVGLDRQTGLWKQKLNHRRELQRLLGRSKRFTTAVNAHTIWPASPPPLQELIASTLPGITISPLSFADQPSVKDWTTRRVSFSMSDIPGDSLEKFFEAATTARPPWSLEECTLLASPSSGRLARVDVVMVAVEHN